MKKLIAIVITFIFIFDGAGYCTPCTFVLWSLRPPLAFKNSADNDPRKKFELLIGHEIDKQLLQGDNGKWRQKLRLIAGQLKNANLEQIGISYDDKKIYRIYISKGLEVIFSPGGFTAVLEGNGRITEKVVQEGLHYKVVSKTLHEQFEKRFNVFIRTQRKISDNTEAYKSWIFFSLINPYVDKKVFQGWFLSSQILRFLLGQLETKEINLRLVNWVHVYPPTARNDNDKAEAYELGREICLGLEVLRKINKEKNGYIKGTAIHEICHHVVKNRLNGKAKAIAAPAMQRLINKLRKLKRYTGRELVEEAIVRVIEALSLGLTHIKPGEYDNGMTDTLITKRMVKVLIEVGLLEKLTIDSSDYRPWTDI